MRPKHVEAMEKKIRAQLGAEPTYRSAGHVSHRSGGPSLWEGMVYSFDLEGDGPSGCYCLLHAHSDPADLALVVGSDSVTSPLSAVKAHVARGQSGASR